MKDRPISRRSFVRRTGAVALGTGVLPGVLKSAVDLESAPVVDRKALVAALGDTIIPTDRKYPGYKRLEQYGITDEVMKGMDAVDDRDYNLFNAAAKEVMGRPFLELDEAGRAQFLGKVVSTFPAGTFGDNASAAAKNELEGKFDPAAIQTLQKVFRIARNRVFNVFYQNFPENRVARDKNMIPLLPPNDAHQIIDPNTKKLVTGWDIANFPGPMSWQEEEARRAKYKKIHWHEE